jgi:hypothetical protein
VLRRSLFFSRFSSHLPVYCVFACWSSASSLFHSPFSPHFWFPSIFFFLSAIKLIPAEAVCNLPCKIRVRIILLFYFPFFQELFVLLPFFVSTLFLILIFWMFFLIFLKNQFLYIVFNM